MVRVVSCRMPTTRWEYKPSLRLAFEAREGGWVVVPCVKTRNTLRLAFEAREGGWMVTWSKQGRGDEWWCGEKTENDPSDSRLKRGRGKGVVDKTTT